MNRREKEEIAGKLMSIGRMLQSLAKEVGDAQFFMIANDESVHFSFYDKEMDVLHIRADWYDVEKDPEWKSICDENGWNIDESIGRRIES